ncbi:AAA family ATPase [filamentous cyanobacterium LEGE 11480]|uniref:AAA family ATPase n=1 Tax=Romeriopsis navalis LEGE 11480 TaxID=2777977 RepID=A0A928VTS4_9CYAN|nr:bifunctional aminoglycoside phosphotransferase/ATP-binding protein [Romeriopsis navalis]MBE9032099.1 AAA family ATPase [Romeriopsis navalis LEGE 11480]
MTDTNLPPVVQAMLQPAVYPHAAQAEIPLIQTHVSYVFLTGDFVYKLKKPVNFGFLDFSTLEKRKHFCEEELRLNQRGAAELYLEVVAITQAGEGFELNGDGEVVEYAVKMQQFPQSALLSEMFEAGTLTAQHMRDLAKEVASFHAKADINDHIRSYGAVAKVRQAFDENYEQSAGFIDFDGGKGPQTQAQFDGTKAYTDDFFVKYESALVDRVKADKIRECHGDAHLRNIALWQEKIWLFDCIEFNEPFRFVDTMYDVGFICMDLDARGRQDFANIFLNAYLEQTGDYEGLQVLPLYLSRQAYVRAKVTSFLLGDPSIPDDLKQSSRQTAAEYYTLAYDYTQQPDGRLVMMAGLSGAGKSTAGKAIAKAHKAIHLRSDAIRKQLAGISVEERGSDAIYTPAMTEKTYDRLLALGLMLAKQGYTVVLDAKYDRTALREPVVSKSQSVGIPLTIVHCDAPMDVLKTRVAGRTGDIADATVDVLAQQSFEAFSDAERDFVKTIDTTADLNAQLKQAGFAIL